MESKRKLIIFAILLFIFLVIISALIFLIFAFENNYFTPSIGKPYNMRLGKFTKNETIILVDVDVCNQNLFTIPISKDAIHGTIKFNDIRLGEILLTQPKNLSKINLTTLTLQLKIDNTLLPDCFKSHVERGESSRINITVPINFTIKNVKFKTKYYNGTTWLNTSLLKIVDAEIKQMSLPFVKIKSVNSKWINDTTFYTDVAARCPIFLPVPFEFDFIANNVSIAKTRILSNYHFLHRRNIKIETRTVIRAGNLDEWLFSHFSKGNVTELIINAKFKILWIEWERMLKKEKYEIDLLSKIKGMKFEKPSKEEKTVTNKMEIIESISILWLLFAIFMLSLYRKYFKS